MELRELEAFVKVASLGSFTRAGEELLLTQPAVTRQIAALEAELNTRLLERLGRRVELTAAGHALYPTAVEMLRLAEDARRAVIEVEAGAAGRLAVGASSTAATYILPPLLTRFRDAHPGVDLSVITGVSSLISERVMNNAVDIGIVTEAQEYRGLHVIPLADSAMVVVAYPSHSLSLRPDSSKIPLRAEDLKDCPLILMQPGTHLRRYVEGLLSSAGVEPTITMELDNVEAIKKMIEARLGVSVLPEVAVRDEVNTGQLISLPLSEASVKLRRIAAIYREDKYLTPPLKTFIGLIEER